MNQEEGNTELVLPIICPKCSHEIDLGMVFSLLPPKDTDEEDQDNPFTPNHESEEA